MKNIYIFPILIILTLSCKAQTTLTLDGNKPDNLNELSKPIYIKDTNNIRDNFYGVWQGSLGNSELTFYIYKVDDVPRQSVISDLFIDSLIGYYIYKENGVEIINSLEEMQNNNTPQDARYAPLYGTTSDGINISLFFVRDYGVQIQGQDGNFFTKKGYGSITFIHNDGLNNPSLSFELKNPPNVLAPYNYDFSIPTSMTLTKIASTPPPLD